jgi:curved DNA binding protein
MADADDIKDYDDESEDEDTTLTSPEVVEKYKLAANFCNQTIEILQKESVPGRRIVELCELGDKTVTDLVAPVFSKKKEGGDTTTKGLAFPTCISVNNVICHFSPLSDNATVLNDGDIVRIDVGVHIDGYAAVGAHTFVIQSTPAPLTGKIADLFAAAQLCIEVAVHGVRPTGTNSIITDLWGKIAESYGVNVCEAVLSHEMKRFVVDGNNVIISKAAHDQKVEEVVFEAAQVWAIDLLLSTGPGKLREEDERPTVYKRAPEQQYILKTQSGRQVLKDINQRFQSFPFTSRALTEKGARLGIAEALKHELLVSYPVLHEKAGENVVHFKSTVLISPTQIERITGLKPQEYATDKKCAVKEVFDLLNTSLRLSGAKKKKKNKKKAKKPEAASSTTAPPAA